jgi:alpha-tubulin suppressor-like RCC1 family protein
MHVFRTLVLACLALLVLSPIGPARADMNDLVSRAPVGAAISTGGYTSCVVLVGDKVSCWGYNHTGQIGDSSTTNRTRPVVIGIADVIGVSVGNAHTCELLADGLVDCWGYNAYGQLGGGTTDSSHPVNVAGLLDAVGVTAGGYHSCAVHRGGTISCWGDNSNGNLGDGTTNARNGIGTVLGVTDAVSVSAGDYHTCALLADGTVWCWGYNGSGRLGDGTTTNRSVPTKVTGITHALSVSAGAYSTCAVMQGGTVRCWGSNQEGTIGDGTTTDRSTPTLVTGVTNAVGVSVGNGHACALIATGAVQCWGQGNFGQLGNGSDTLIQPTATTVAGLPNAIAVSAANGHTCAVLTSGTVKCWGENGYGQLGYGDYDQRGDTGATAPGHLPAVQLSALIRTVDAPPKTYRLRTRTTSNHPARDRHPSYRYPLKGSVVATGGTRTCSGKVTVTVRYGTKRVATGSTTLHSSCRYAVTATVTKAKLNAALPKKLRSRRTPVTLHVTLAYGGNAGLLASSTVVTVKAR